MKKSLITLSSLALVLAPVFVFAQNISTGTTCTSSQSGIQSIICKIGEILNTAIPIIIVLGVFYLVWGIVQYVISGDEEAKKNAKDKIIYGIIGLVVIVSIWGLVGIVTKTFGLNNNPGGIKPPCVPGTPGC